MFLIETEKKLKFLKNTCVKWNFIGNFNAVILKNIIFLKNILSTDKPRKETLSRIFGNEMFRKKNLNLAIEFYNLSLGIIPLSRELERSFCFSNRAQCLLGLNRENYTLVDCEMALKLIKNHEKSWYRKIFVYTIKKDHAGNFLNFWKIICLSVIFGKFQLLDKTLSLSKILARFEKILSKEKYWKKFQGKKKKKSFSVLRSPQRRCDSKDVKLFYSRSAGPGIFSELKEAQEIIWMFNIFFLNNFFFFLCSKKSLGLKNFYKFSLKNRKNFWRTDSSFFFNSKRKFTGFAFFFQTIFFKKSSNRRKPKLRIKKNETC